MTTVTKRSLAYDAIYGSDIFNLLPQKVKQNTTFGNKKNLSSSTQMKNALSCKDIFYKRNKNDNNNNKENLLSSIPTKSNYSKYLSEFHNINIISPPKNLPQSSKGILKNELKASQPFKFTNQTNRVESLKSNIFNDSKKENQNYMFNTNYIPIRHNNWNTNLDWKNSKSELVFMRNKKNEDKVNCNDLQDYYNHKNIVNHKYKVDNVNDIDLVQLEKNIKKEGLQMYNIEYKSDFLKGHSDQSMTFNVRENNNCNFNEKIDNVAKQEQLDIKNISNYKVDLHPHKYFQKNIKKNDLIMNDYSKKGKIKN